MRLAIAPRDSLLRAIEHNYQIDKFIHGILENSDAFQSQINLEKENLIARREDGEEVEEELNQKDSSPVARLVEIILARAVDKRVSDIHIEPKGEILLVRYRRDGILQQEMDLPIWALNPMVSRIKILSTLDIAEKRLPQDGRLGFHYKEKKYICRVSTLPTYRGEKVVLRILDTTSLPIELPKLGFAEENLKSLSRIIRKPQGIILSTGPTGSGKSTTLHSILNTIKSEEINITTVEDPVEYENPSFSQVQINPKTGLTFAKALRSILRQDPDVLLIGEIRDLETAVIAFEASMTGHLIFSTIHTNDTASTVTRLLELGLEPFLVASSLELLFSQRLVRKICESCKEFYEPTGELLEEYPSLRETTLCRGKGCKECEGLGFKGRIGVYEMMTLSREMRDSIQRGIQESDLRKKALENGMIPIWEVALNLVRENKTTLEEVLRVVQEPGENETKSCPSCQTPLKDDFICCPFCRATLKVTCVSCDKTLEPEWVICPYCNTSKSRSVLKQRSLLNPKVMVVEDDNNVRRLLEVWIEKMFPQTEVLVASQGVEALEKAQKYRPNLILMDVIMPGMTGVAVCDCLNKNPLTRDIPVILITSAFNDEIKTDAYRVGAEDFLSKPLNLEEIRIKVGKVLGLLGKNVG